MAKKATERKRGSGAAAEWVRISRLVPWERNPRKNDQAVDEVAASIQRFGWGSPILARKQDRRVIAGHTRLKAAAKLGLKEVPVRWLDLDPVDADLLALADNKLGELAEWDDEALAKLLAEMDLDDLSGTGFDQRELDRLAREVEGLLLDAGMTDEFSLPDGPRPLFEQMTFTLTHDQAETVKDALAAAKAAGPFEETGNENGNANALERICGGYRGAS